MITETYGYLFTKDKTQFVFQSEGTRGKIIKIVQFNLIGGQRWNLGFGDWKFGNIDDLVISNNQDAIKVVRTVAKITIDFFEQNPQCIIVINPIDEKRKRLYNFVFKRHFKDIVLIYEVIGLIGKKKENYNPEKFYDSFEIYLKFES